MDTLRLSREYKEDVLEEWRERDKKKRHQWEDLVKEHRFTLRRSAQRLILKTRVFLSGEFGWPTEKAHKDYIYYAIAGDFFALRSWLLAYGDNPGVVDHQNELDGKTALHIACQRSDLRMVQHLLLRKAKVNVRDRFGCFPLHYACSKGAIDCADHLLRVHAQVDGRDKFGVTPLMKAAEIGDADIIDLLLEYAAAPNIKDKMERWTALHYAAKSGDLECIRSLLKSGADFSLYSLAKQNAQSIALDFDRKEAAILLGKWRRKKMFPNSKLKLADFDEDLDL